MSNTFFKLFLIIDYLANLRAKLHRVESKYKLASSEYSTLRWRSCLEDFFSQNSDNSHVADILNNITSGLQLNIFMSKKFAGRDVDPHLNSQRLQKEEKARKILLNNVL